jgi:hypothetical protein
MNNGALSYQHDKASEEIFFCHSSRQKDKEIYIFRVNISNPSVQGQQLASCFIILHASVHLFPIHLSILALITSFGTLRRKTVRFSMSKHKKQNSALLSSIMFWFYG